MTTSESRRFLKKSLRDWLIFSVGIIGIAADAVYSQVFGLPAISFPVLLICNVLAAIMGGVGLPISSSQGNYTGATTMPWTRWRLLAWLTTAVVANFTVSGIIAPSILSDEVADSDYPSFLFSSNILPGILGAVPWMIVSGVLAAFVAVVVHYVLRSIFLASDDVVTRRHLRGAVGIGALSFLVGAATLSPLGTIGWIVGQLTPPETPITELRRLLFSVIGVAILAGVLLHYLLWSFSARERRRLARSVEVVVTGIAIIEAYSPAR